MDMKRSKEFYEAPAMEVAEVKFEGLICSSNKSMGLEGTGGSKNVEGREDGGNWGGDDGWK